MHFQAPSGCNIPMHSSFQTVKATSNNINVACCYPVTNICQCADYTLTKRRVDSQERKEKQLLAASSLKFFTAKFDDYYIPFSRSFPGFSSTKAFFKHCPGPEMSHSKLLLFLSLLLNRCY